jgi:hypothetical protein
MHGLSVGERLPGMQRGAGRIHAHEQTPVALGIPRGDRYTR